MFVAKRSVYINEGEYLAAESDSDIRHEYIDGDIVAMAGAGKNHRRLAGNLFGFFHDHLKADPCEASMGDARVKVAGNYFYPDIVVDCDKASDNDDSLYADKPTIIVEVLSRSTRHADRGIKLLSYINIESLQEYVLVEQEFASIEVLRRRDGWVQRHYALGDEIYFESIDLTLSVAEIYYRVTNKDMTAFLANEQAGK